MARLASRRDRRNLPPNSPDPEPPRASVPVTPEPPPFADDDAARKALEDILRWRRQASALEASAPSGTAHRMIFLIRSAAEGALKFLARSHSITAERIEDVQAILRGEEPPQRGPKPRRPRNPKQQRRGTRRA
jgi:hypothetical protein